MKETSQERSRIMRRVKERDTGPEMVVRRLVYSLGYRYRLHRKDLPGKPDLVFAGRRKVIFVHGCFWHGHDCKRGARLPKTNVEYWVQKIARNKKRDKEHEMTLTNARWDVLVVWECQLRDEKRLSETLMAFLANT